MASEAFHLDPRERLGDLETAILAALKGLQARIWTALPGIIESFDPEALTAVVQPALQGIQSNPDGSATVVTMPLLLDCPVQFAGGGGVTSTFPLAPGDECLVVFASRCIDAWWQSGGVQPQAERRMHDLSDGFVIPGVRSQARRLANVSTTSAQMRSDDGSTIIDLDPITKVVTITAPGGAVIDADVQVNGTVTATGDVKAGAISLQQHVHGGVQSGTANTGAATG